MDWNDDDARSDNEGPVPSATDPAIDARGFAKVVESEADRLVELAEDVRATVNLLVLARDYDDEDDPLTCARDMVEQWLEDLVDEVGATGECASGVLDHARALVDLYRDEVLPHSGHRHRGRLRLGPSVVALRRSR